MKKQYEMPILAHNERLSDVAAKLTASGVPIQHRFVEVGEG